MNNTDKQYKDLVNLVLDTGSVKEDRTGVGTIGIFGHQMRFNLKEGFPLVTLKKTHYPAIIHELLWFLDSMPDKYAVFGNTNIKYLVDNNCHIWDEWSFERFNKEHPNKFTQAEFIEEVRVNDEFALHWGDLGPIYGKQWVRWEKVSNTGSISWINQIQVAIDRLKEFPEDRGIIVSAWNVSQLGQMALRPCHTMFQFYAVKMSLEDKVKYMNNNYPLLNEFGWDLSDEEYLKEVEFKFQIPIPKYKLSLQLYQRSCDIGLGLPFNIASYALLLEMVAQVTGMVANEFIHTIGDAHIYSNHVEKLQKINERESFELPKLILNRKIKNITDFRFDDIQIEDYQYNKGIILPVAV
jgi:thymidylate synthase